MDRNKNKWFECWFADNFGSGVVPGYILYVTPATDEEGGIVVLDPQKRDAVAFRGKDYHEVTEWLSDDEFEQVTGRMFRSDYAFGTERSNT